MTWFFIIMIKIFILLISAMLFSGCEQAHQSLDTGLDSIRVVKTDLEKQKILYVPARAIFKGPGNKQQPLKLELNDQLTMVQGMLKIVAEKKDVETLKSRVQKEFGDKMTVSTYLSGSYKISLVYNDKTLIDTETIAIDINLPVQLTAKKGKPIEMQVNIRFEPYMTAGKRTKSTSTYSYKKSINNQTQSSAASATKQVEINSEKPESFEVKQIISF
jgi:hypothetical protein